MAFAAAAEEAENAEEPRQPNEIATNSLNGFVLDGSALLVPEIIAGGPKRDAIVSVDAPAFVEPRLAEWVRPDTPVIGVELAGEAHCYPVHAMEYHQIVNDVIAGRAVVVTYDPLTDTAISYERTIGERTLEFGVSGLIRNSNFLLYDRKSESLWSQFRGLALTGAMVGTRLVRVRTRTESMGAWLARNPATRVMTLPARRRIDYRYSHYMRYWTSNEIPFPVAARDARFHPKELVLGVRAEGRSRAYIASILTRAGGRIVDVFAGRKIRILYDGATGTFVFDAPAELEVTSAYWFAWKAHHPDTDIWHETDDSAAEGEAR